MSAGIEGRNRAIWLVTVIVIVSTAHFVRFGYDFGTSDQDEVIPAVLNRLDETVLANDWYVQSQAEALNVRSATILVLTPISRVVGVAGATLLLYLVSICLLIIGTVLIARRLSGGAIAELLAPVLLLVLTPRFTLGGNDLSHAIYVPSMTAWGLALIATAMILSGRGLVAGILFGLATLFQPLAGLLTALVTAAGLFIADPRGEAIRRGGLMLVVTAVVASPLLVPIFAAQISEAAGPVGGAAFFDIIVQIRAPHHFLPSAFSERSAVQFGVLTIAGLASLILSPALREHRRPILSILLIIALGCVLYTIGVELMQSPTIAKSQFYKLTVLAKTFAGICVAVSIDQTLSNRYRLHISTRPIIGLLVATGGLLALSMLAGPLKNRFAILSREGAAWHDVYGWASSNTDPDAIFVVPPSNSDMRSWGRRSIVVNFKATAFQSTLMQEWHRRLGDISDNPDVSHRYVEPIELDLTYEALSGDRLLELRGRYDFEYVVRSTPLQHAAWSEEFRAGTVGADAVYVYAATLPIALPRD